MSEHKTPTGLIPAQPKLSEGVALLVQRMESHPEEFTHGNRKWEHVLGVVEERIFNPQGMRRAEPWMTDEEIRAIWGGYQKVKQKSFHDFVMKKLLDDSEEEDLWALRYKQEQMLRNQPLVVKNPLNGLIQPGQWVNATNNIAVTGTGTGTLEAEPSPSFIQKIKRELGL